MKAYEMIIKDGYHAFCAVRAGKSKDALIKQYSGNGEFISVKDITTETPIDLTAVRNALMRAGFGELEQDLIISLVQKYENAY